MAFWDKVKGFFLGKSETQVIREKAAKQARKKVKRKRPDLPKTRERETPPPATAPVGEQYDYIDETVIDERISWAQKVNDLESIWEDRQTPETVKRDAFEEWWQLVEPTFTPISDFDWDAFREYYRETMPSGPAHSGRGY